MNLILIRGLPGSGKSTLANLMACSIDSAVHFEADQYFIDINGQYKWDQSLIREAHEWCQSSTEQHLEAGSTVIVSNTFTTVSELRPYFKIAKKFEITPTVILCQNDWGNIHNVPDETIS